MRIAFTASEASGFDDDYALSCGVSGSDAKGAEHYLGFDRLNEKVALESPEEDWGVHTEFDDQSNGAYGVLKAVRLTRTILEVDLSQQLGRLEEVTGFDVQLSIDDESFAELEQFVRRILRGMPAVYS